MNIRENTQEESETIVYDLPHDDFQPDNHPWLVADLTVGDEIRFALDEIRL